MWGVSRAPGPPGPSRALQEPPGASRGLRGFQGPLERLPEPQNAHERRFERKMRPAAYSQSPEPWARLKFHAGWSGWTRPPTMAGGGGGGQAEACLQGGVEGVFKGI